MSILIVGVMLLPALSAAVASRTGQRQLGDERRGQALAEALMSEILQQPYNDPNDPPLFGLEAGEGNLTRAAFDDVDDYDAWSASPPQRPDGTVLANLGGWQRSVTVVWVNPNDLTNVVGSDQGIKRITVTVTHDGIVRASLVAIRVGTAATINPGAIVRKLPLLRS